MVITKLNIAGIDCDRPGERRLGLGEPMRTAEKPRKEGSDGRVISRHNGGGFQAIQRFWAAAKPFEKQAAGA